MLWGIFIKWCIMMVAAFFAGTHLGKANNPRYADDDLGPQGHLIVAAVFITGASIGAVVIIQELIAMGPKL